MARWKKISDIKALPCYSHIPTRLVYLHLCMECDPVTGHFAFSHRDMAYTCKVSLREVRTALNSMIRDGLVTNCVTSSKGTEGVLSAYAKPVTPKPKDKGAVDIDYVLREGWLRDMLPIITSSYPMSKYEARKAGTQFVMEMRSIGKTWADKEDVRKHHLYWLQRDYLGIKTKKELSIKRKIYEDKLKQKKGE